MIRFSNFLVAVLLIVGGSNSVKACVDKNAMCPFWAGIGECCKNPRYMLTSCAKSCGQCGTLPDKSCGCENKAGDAECNDWAALGRCCTQEGYMHVNCRRACAQCDEPKPVPGCPCMNHNSNCEGWARNKACGSAQVKKSCPKACGLCKPDQHSFHVCEGQSGTITCPPGTVIEVNQPAFYGRTNTKTCPRPGYMRTTNCQGQGSGQKIRAMCEGKTQCTVLASNAIFGDPCPMTVKYSQLKYRCKPKPIAPKASANCQGFDLMDPEIDNAVAATGACKAVEVMKTIQDATLCQATGTQAFGKAQTLFKNGLDVGLICDLISDSLSLGVLFPPNQCSKIHRNIINPIMRGTFNAGDIERLVRAQLEDIVPNVLNMAQGGVNAFNSFLDSVNFCPAVNFSPDAWKGKFDKVFELIKAIKMLHDKGPTILAKFVRNVEKSNCKTYSVVFTVDISALAILGAQRGIYVTWHMDQGVKEVGTINGVSASYNLDPDFDISIGATVAILMGTKEVWGEWGYTLEFGASVPIYGVGVGLSGGIVFTADANTKALGNFVGFTFGLDFSLGESSTTVDYDASVTCGYVAASSFKDAMKNNAACLSAKSRAVNNLLSSFRNTKDVFDRKVDELERCGNLYACQAKQCAYGFSGDNFNTCQSAAGKCSAGMKECGKWELHCEKTTSCKQRACRSVTREVCKFFGWLGLSKACNDVTDTICDGACLIYNVAVEKVVTGVSCAAKGMVEVVEKTRCLEHLPMCAGTGGCYFGQGVLSAAQCAGGMVMPSEKCLRDNKFI